MDRQYLSEEMRIPSFILYIYCVLTGLLFSCTNISDNNFKEPSGNQKGSLTLVNRACYFADADSIENKTQIKIDTPSCREIEQIQSIMEYAGLPQNFKIYRGNIDNALATVVDNQRLIIYNKDLFTTLDELSSSYWASLFIIAHEIGHHLANNISDDNNILQSELDADKFAGFILFRMGADSNQVTDAVASNLISVSSDSKTHPAKMKRIEVVKKSWKESYDLRFLSAIPPAINDAYAEAANKPYVYDVVQNHLNGYPPFYHPRGYNDNQLINNDFGFSLIDSNYFRNYSWYRSSDSSIYEFLPNVSRNYQGIIIDVKSKPARAEFEELVFLEISILITHTDESYNYAGLLVNQRYPFLVCFKPGQFTQSIIDYMGFFAGGRRLEFDLIDLNKKDLTYGLLNISRAYSL